MSLIGSLDEVKIADVLRLFSTGKKSGLLTVARGTAQALLRFQKGAIIHASAGRLQGEEAVLDLFGWKEGQLTFVPEDRPVAPNVSKGVDALILEGLRIGETLHRMHELIPTDRVVFQAGPGPSDGNARYSVGAAEWRVLRVLDGVRDVREVVEATKMPRAEVVRVLFEMTEAGFLEKLDVQRPLRVAAQGIFGREAAEVDERVGDDWRKIFRFAAGVQRIEVRSLVGKTATLGVSFRRGLIREIHLPRGAIGELGVREGEEVTVRPVG